MNQELTPRERTILTVVGMLIGLALMSSMTSCNSSKGLTSCQYVNYKMSGYYYK